MEGVVSGCFRFNINGPISVASTVDDLGGGSSRVPRAGTHDEPLKTFAGRLLYLRLRGVFPLTRNLEECVARGRLCNVWVTITFTQRSCDSLK